MGSGPTRTMVVVPPLLRSASGTSGNITITDQYYSGFIAMVDVTATSSPTSLDVFIQRGLKSAAATDIEQGQALGALVFDDYARFGPIAATGRYMITVNNTSGLTAVHNLQDATLAASANAVVSGPIGGLWRIKWVMVGTSYTFSVVVNFIP